MRLLADLPDDQVAAAVVGDAAIPVCSVVALCSYAFPGMLARDLPDLTDLAKLAYETSLRTLATQEASLNELRARTGTLVAAASLVTSFLGGAAFTRSGFDVWSVVALVAFGLTIGAATWVLLPRKNHLVFALHGSKLYEGEIRDDVFAIGETYRRLSYWLDEFHDDNDPKINRLFDVYRGATACLLVEVVAWSVQLALG